MRFKLYLIVDYVSMARVKEESIIEFYKQLEII